MISMVSGHWSINIEAAVMQWLLTVASFPVIYALCYAISLPAKEGGHYAE